MRGPEDMTSESQGLSEQAKQSLKDRARQQLETGTTTAAQKVSSVAQSLRMTADQLRGQGQEQQGQMVDRVTQKVQQAGQYLNQSNADSILTDARQAPQKAKEKTQQVRGQAGGLLRSQIDSRSGTAGEKVSSYGQTLRMTAEQMRGQGEETQAKVVEQVAEKVEQLGGYLTQSDSDRILGDLRGYAQRFKGMLSRTKQTVGEKGGSLVSKSGGTVTEKAKGAAGIAKQRPASIALGAVAGAVLMGRRAAKRMAQPQNLDEAQAPMVDATLPTDATILDMTPPPADNLELLTKDALMQRAREAGLPVRPSMTKAQLVEALRRG